MSQRPTAALLGLTATLLLPLAVAWAQQGPITIVAPHHDEEVTFFGVGDDNRLHPPELGLLQQLLRCRRTGRTHELHPDLGRRLIQVGRRFNRPVYVVSGYRAVVVRGHRRSYHLRGMAADIYVPGVSPRAIRDFAVGRRFGGIGYYPNSGFVHLDVRQERFWWVDYSEPGRVEPLVPDPEGTAPAHRPEADEATTPST